MFPVPRVWLTTLSVLMVVPWLIVATMYWRAPADEVDSAGADPTIVTPSTRAGRLMITPIVIAPPMEYVPADWGRLPETNAWFFTDITEQAFDALLASSGLTQQQIGRIKGASLPEPRIRGFVVRPDAGLLREMTPEARATLYARLGRSHLNIDHSDPLRFHAESTEEWLRGSLIEPATRALVEPLIYRQGEFLSFADAAYVLSQLRDREELRRLLKTLLRQSTVLVRLSVPDTSDVPALAEYWGRGGRSTDIRPLLESVAGAEDANRSIDIAHLLPAFARNHLYRYPQPSTADALKPALANCLWTALNFFGPRPDDRFLELQEGIKALRENYYTVEGEFQLGDIVGFVDAEGDLYHVAVYLADDLLFTKNGTSPLSPWTIMRTQDVIGYYQLKAENPRLIYHRRKDL